MFFDISTCLEGQTTSESCETRTVVSVSKIASQRFKNHIDPTSVLREKPQKPKYARRKRRNDDAWPSPEPPNRGARIWGLAIAEPCRREGSAIGWPTPQGPGDPLQGPPTAPFDDVFRHFYMFGGSNDLGIMRNKDCCVRIEDSFATVQESHRSDFGASRKAPKTKVCAKEKAKRRRVAEPRAPQQGSSAMGLSHSRAPQTRGVGHWMVDPPRARGPPAGSPDSPFRRCSSTLLHVWRVKRPQNPTKQAPLCPYRR